MNWIASQARIELAGAHGGMGGAIVEGGVAGPGSVGGHQGAVEE